MAQIESLFHRRASNQYNKIGRLLFTILVGFLTAQVIIRDNVYIVILMLAAVFVVFAFLCPRQAMLLILTLCLFTGPAKILLGVREFPLILDAALIFLTFLLIIDNYIFHDRSIALPRLSKPILLLLIISVIQMFNTGVPNIQIALEGFRQSAFYMISFFISAYLIREKKHIYQILVIIVISSVVIGIYGMRQHYFPFQAEINWASALSAHTFWGLPGTERTLRVFSTFNGLGAYWVFIPLAVVSNLTLLHIVRKPKHKYLILLTTTIVVISSLFTLGRAAWISSVIGIIALMLFLDNRPTKKILIVSAVVLFCSFLFIKTFPGMELVRMRFQTLANPLEDYNVTFRLAIMKDALDWISQHPFGRGVGMTSSGIITRYGTPNIAGHNQFLDVAIELGFFAMLIYLYVVLTSIWIGIKTARECSDTFIRIGAAWLTSYNLAYHAIGMQGQVFGFPQSLYYWSLLGILVNLKDMDKACIANYEVPSKRAIDKS